MSRYDKGVIQTEIDAYIGTLSADFEKKAREKITVKAVQDKLKVLHPASPNEDAQTGIRRAIYSVASLDFMDLRVSAQSTFSRGKPFGLTAKKQKVPNVSIENETLKQERDQQTAGPGSREPK